MGFKAFSELQARINQFWECKDILKPFGFKRHFFEKLNKFFFLFLKQITFSNEKQEFCSRRRIFTFFLHQAQNPNDGKISRKLLERAKKS